ncbi:monocarboxylate transporter 5-like isoform X2 [Mizuhopecten yessoensis]|uniref:monocarboxylate transporter 5-like isoform X2 n=1 Tax=Mizuhopecten yessoensis TaxID=6573 RepID=UPI000B457496|nr:monocarboxylate transporter 5-like isoform X2 [Mizuhopecten yessoensis]
MTDPDHDDMGTRTRPEDTEIDIIHAYELPVDRGWAWVILAATTLITTLYAGIFKSFGLFYVEILDVYSGNVSTTSLISSLQFAVYCLTTLPIMTSLLRHCSIRSCQIAGILITALGFGLSSLVHSLDLLILTQSILSGLGMALVFPTAIVLVGKYFKGRAGLANGVLMSGYALGGVALPPLMRYILDEYRLEGALLLTAGIILNCLPLAFLIQPIDFHTQQQQKPGKTVTLEGRSEIRELRLYKPKSAVNLPSNCVNSESNNGYSTEFSDGHHMHQMRALLSDYNTDLNIASASAPNLSSPKNVTNHTFTKDQNTSDSQIDTIAIKCNVVYSEPRIFKYLSTGELAYLSQELGWNASSDHNSSNSFRELSIIKRAINHCKSWQMCSPKLWRNKDFLMLIPIYCFASVGGETSHLFIPSFAKDRGVESSRIAALVSIQFMCDFSGRILSGYIADLPRVRRPQIVMASQLIAGLIMQMTPLFQVFWSLVIFSVGYGLTAGIIFVLFPPILSAAVGQEMFPTSMAVMILIKGCFVSGIIPFLGLFDKVAAQHTKGSSTTTNRDV